MQLIVTYATYISLIINITQEFKLKMIVKTYVALCFLCTIDDIFAKLMPQSVLENAKAMNSSGMLVIREDFNTTKLILSNMCGEGNRDRLSVILWSFGQMLINLWYFILQETRLVVFNYFAAIVVLLF